MKYLKKTFFISSTISNNFYSSLFIINHKCLGSLTPHINKID